MKNIKNKVVKGRYLAVFLLIIEKNKVNSINFLKFKE